MSEDREKFISHDLKEYIHFDDYTIKRYLNKYKDKLHLLENQIQETLEADQNNKITKDRASHFSYYINLKS